MTNEDRRLVVAMFRCIMAALFLVLKAPAYVPHWKEAIEQHKAYAELRERLRGWGEGTDV